MGERKGTMESVGGLILLKKILIKEGKRQIFKEILIVFSCIFGFMVAACISKLDMMLEHKGAFITTAVATVLNILGWMWLSVSFWTSSNSKGIVKKNLGEIAVIVYCILTRLPQITDTPKWDGSQYYQELVNACAKFDFTIESFVRGFALASHPTLSFAGIAAIGEFLNPKAYTGVIITQMALNVVMAFCLYRIIQKMLPQCTRLFHIVSTCVVLSVPLVLGTFSYFHPDAGTVYFFVFIVYCYLFKRNILLFGAMFLVCLTKEIGIVVLAGLGIGAFVGYLIFENIDLPIRKKIICFFKEPLGVSGLFGAGGIILFFIYTLSHGGGIWHMEGGGISGFSTFSFQAENILFRLKQYFILQFNWVFWGIILCLCIYGCINRNWWGDIKRKDILVMFASAGISIMLFYAFYVTFGNPRYLLLISFSAAFISVILIGGCVKDGNLKNLQVLLLCVLLLIDSYTMIDFVSGKVFETGDTGNGKMIVERNHNVYVGEYTVTNHQYAYLNKALERIFRDIDYNGIMDVMVWDKKTDGDIMTSFKWDVLLNKMSYVEGDTVVVPNVISYFQIADKKEELSETVVFLFVSQYGTQDEDKEFIKEYYEIRYEGSVEIPFGGKIDYMVGGLNG